VQSLLRFVWKIKKCKFIFHYECGTEITTTATWFSNRGEFKSNAEILQVGLLYELIALKRMYDLDIHPKMRVLRLWGDRGDEEETKASSWIDGGIDQAH